VILPTAVFALYTLRCTHTCVVKQQIKIPRPQQDPMNSHRAAQPHTQLHSMWCAPRTHGGEQSRPPHKGVAPHPSDSSSPLTLLHLSQKGALRMWLHHALGLGEWSRGRAFLTMRRAARTPGPGRKQPSGWLHAGVPQTADARRGHRLVGSRKRPQIRPSASYGQNLLS